MQKKLFEQVCAICEKNNYDILYKRNFKMGDLNEKIFSARRIPDRIHYQIVRCKVCRLVYSNPIARYEEIEKLYKKSFVNYDEQINNLQKTYGYYLSKLKQFNVDKNTLLEIGCGSGFFLEEALKQGYKNVYGVEPGAKSVAKASLKVKKDIVVDIFKPGIFQKDFFDVICCFQTFDHIPDPNNFLIEIYKLLKKGGYVLFLNHDVEAISAKILGEKSPIIDIEHTFLYSKKTIQDIFIKHNFKIINISHAVNIHNLDYLIKLFPLPNIVKKNLIKVIQFLRIKKINIKINSGNLMLIAKK